MVAAVGAGVCLDLGPSLSQPLLCGCLMVASALGMVTGLTARPASVCWSVLAGLAVLAWRVAYFPIMVFSGFVASLSEVLVGLVYPAFLLSAWALHGLVGWSVTFCWPPDKERWQPLAVAVPLALIAGMVSFTSLSDLRLQPDQPWAAAPAVLRVEEPVTNPYLPRLSEPGYSPQGRVLLLCAGLTYGLIPSSPWARAVKGTLEAEMNRRPHAGTRQRVEEHYRAYVAAHSRIQGLRR